MDGVRYFYCNKIIKGSLKVMLPYWDLGNMSKRRKIDFQVDKTYISLIH